MVPTNLQRAIEVDIVGGGLVAVFEMVPGQASNELLTSSSWLYDGGDDPCVAARETPPHLPDWVYTSPR